MLMKKFVFAGAALAVLGDSAALAQPALGPRNAQPLTRAVVEQRVDAGFARVDANRDGFVTQEEARAVAQARRGQRGEMRGARQGQRVERRAERFAQLDSNRDGMISRAEFDAHTGVRGGNRAERREARAERQGMRGQRRGGGQGGGMFARFGGAMFGQADANRDGRVSRQEARSGALALFARIDTNRDGTVSVEERRAAREGMRAQRQGRRQG
jgi:Ca2+-binding EF-hand superfamily protein